MGVSLNSNSFLQQNKKISLWSTILITFGLCSTTVRIMCLFHSHQNYWGNLEWRWWIWKMKMWQWIEFSTLWGWSVFWKKSKKKKKSSSFYHLSSPPLFPLVHQFPFQLNGFLSEMQMFSWVTFLWNIVEWSPLSFMGDTHAALERGLQREFENTESNGISVWLKQ